MSTPTQTVSNQNVILKVAILADGFAKPANFSTNAKTLVAASDINFSFSDQTVSADTYGSGYATQTVKVAGSFSANISGLVAKDDEVYREILMVCGGNTSDAQKNVYFELTDGNGDKYEGAAQISNLNVNLALRDIMKFSCTLNGQGEVDYTPAPVIP